MKKPADAYREGYEKGRAANLAGHVGEAMFIMMRDDPGGYYAAGYSDGAAGKKFQLPVRASASRPVIADVSVNEEERAWFRLCDSSEFISISLANEHWERLKAAKSNPAVYIIGLHPFFESSCPHCGEEGHFKGRFLGWVRHPQCGCTWYVRPLCYMGKQLAGVYHSGLRAGGSVKEQADRKGDRFGGWMQGFLAFYIVAALRLMLALLLIPIQAAVSLAQSKPKPSPFGAPMPAPPEMSSAPVTPRVTGAAPEGAIVSGRPNTPTRRVLWALAAGLLLAGVLTFRVFKSSDVPATGRGKASGSTMLVDQMATDIPEIRNCLSSASRDQVAAVLELSSLNLKPDKTTILVSGTGQEPCRLFGARMPLQWIYERTTGGYRKLLDVGPVDSVTVLPEEHLGYKDIRISVALSGGATLFTQTGVFNGQQYRLQGDGRDVPIHAGPTPVVQSSPPTRPEAAVAGLAVKPSFDCGKAKTPTEQLICRDSDLALLEGTMAAAYHRVLAKLDATQTVALKREHLVWFKGYARVCNSVPTDEQRKSCISQNLTDRTRQLEARLR
jgi:uncharacterized protein YecT (DUF1311 family)